MGCQASKVAANVEVKLLDSTVKLVRESWVQLTDADNLGNHGINLVIRLFLAHPEIRYLWKFAESLKTEQELRESAKLRYHGKRIMETIGVALKSLTSLDVLDVVLLELGSRHYTYGVKAEHFPYVKEAFFSVLSDALGTRYTPELEKAWDFVFTYVANKMLEGLKDCELLNIQTNDC